MESTTHTGDNLPDDVLKEVFGWALQDKLNGPEMVRYAQVCRRWRDVLCVQQGRLNLEQAAIREYGAQWRITATHLSPDWIRALVASQDIAVLESFQLDEESKKALCAHAVRCGRETILFYCVDNMMPEGTTKQSLFWDAVITNSGAAVTALLKDPEIDPNKAIAESDQKPVQCAVAKGNLKVLEALLADKRVDVSGLDGRERFTPFEVAARCGYTPICRTLLQDGRFKVTSDLLMVATNETWSADIVCALLADDRVDPLSGADACNTALHRAVERRNPAMVRSLLADGRIDPNIAVKDDPSHPGQHPTLLHAADCWGVRVALLADPRTDRRIKNASGQVALEGVDMTRWEERIEQEKGKQTACKQQIDAEKAARSASARRVSSTPSQTSWPAKVGIALLGSFLLYKLYTLHRLKQAQAR